MEKPTPADMMITHSEDGSNGIYLAKIEGKPDAKLTYSRVSDSLIIVDHTYVPPQMRGMGIAAKLVERVVRDAQASGTRIDPACPYVKAQIARHKEWQDVLS